MTVATLTVGGGRLADLGRLELVKWAAFVCMVADHVDLAMFGRGVPWLHALGSFAFPVFCLTFGLGVERSGDVRAVALRLVLPALAAQLAWVLIRPGHPANVLAVFLFCCFALDMGRTFGRAAEVLAWAGIAWFSFNFGEGGAYGVALVAAGVLASRLGAWWPVAVAGGLWLVLVPTVGTLAALAAVLWWPALAPRLGRTRGLLAWGYAGHLAALAGLVLARAV